MSERCVERRDDGNEPPSFKPVGAQRAAVLIGCQSLLAMVSAVTTNSISLLSSASLEKLIFCQTAQEMFLYAEFHDRPASPVTRKAYCEIIHYELLSGMLHIETKFLIYPQPEGIAG